LKRLSVVILAMVALGWATPAFAAFAIFMTSPTNPIGACGGWGTTTNGGPDGCAGAPTANPYAVQDSGFFGTTGPGYAQMDGQVYATTGGCAPTVGFPSNTPCHPPWAVAGADYAVGVNANMISAFATPGGVSDPTVASNWTRTANNGCSYASNMVTCSSNPTGTDTECQTYYPAATQCLDVGPFDWGPAGNAPGGTSVGGVNLSITSGVTVPCVIHDNNFLWDIGTSRPVNTVTGYALYGCSNITFVYNILRVQDQATGVYNAWDPVSPLSYVAYFLSENQGQTGALLNRPFLVEYNAFVSCPARCIAIGHATLKYNYFKGLGIYTATHGNGGFHGDGYLPVWYDNVCGCSGNDGIFEQFDTWLETPNAFSQNTCFACGIIHLQDYNYSGQVTKGVASVIMNSISPGQAAGPQLNDITIKLHTPSLVLHLAPA
jgi:hypothetical protein